MAKIIMKTPLVEMDGDGHPGVLRRGDHQRPDELERRVFQAHLGDLQDDGAPRFLSRLEDAEHHFHIRYAETAGGPVFAGRGAEDFFQVDQRHTNHIPDKTVSVSAFVQRTQNRRNRAFR